MEHPKVHKAIQGASQGPYTIGLYMGYVKTSILQGLNIIVLGICMCIPSVRIVMCQSENSILTVDKYCNSLLINSYHA